MKRFIEGQSREQVTLLPACLDDYIGEDNPVRIVDAFVEPRWPPKFPHLWPPQIPPPWPRRDEALKPAISPAA